VRLCAPVVAGEPVRATARLALCIDFTTLVGLRRQTSVVSMINPDVTAHLLRLPVGEWVAITGDTRLDGGVGRGVSSAVLSDGDGVFGVASVSQLLQPR
jgi:hypothetical protein